MIINRTSLVFMLVAFLIVVACNKNQNSNGNSKEGVDFHTVMARKNSRDTVWNCYVAKTVDRLPGFEISNDPELDRFGGWKVDQAEATGFFRVEKRDGRWWIIDPDGYPFIHKGVAVFRPGRSENQKSALINKYGTKDNWAKQESDFFKDNGFNGVGAWSDVDLLRNSSAKFPYTVIVGPMGSYKREHKQKYGEYEESGWQGYRYDLAMVFDPEFEAHIEKEISKITKYVDDKYLIGYYTDNELPWVNDALKRHITKLGKDEAG